MVGLGRVSVAIHEYRDGDNLDFHYRGPHETSEHDSDPTDGRGDNFL